MGRIKNMGTSTMRFKEGIIVTGSACHPDGTDSDYVLIVSGNQFIDASGGGGLTIFKEEPDTSFIRFVNSDDSSGWYAYFAFDNAEHLYLHPGRSQDFYVRTRQNSGGTDPTFYGFRLFDNGKAKFEAGQTSLTDSRVDLPSDVCFFVSGSDDFNNNALFNGILMTSASLRVDKGGVIQRSGSQDFHIDADNEMFVSAGAGTLSYKVKTDGNVEFVNAVTSSHFKVEGSGGQFVAHNEDTVKLKHVNWYSSNDRQYGQGQLWYQQWFGAIEPSDSGDQGNRRIGFFFHKPNRGASDADGGTSAHPTNTHMYLDRTGMYLQTGSFDVQEDAVISGSLSFEDVIMAELTIPGLQAQTDTNAYTFDLPYGVTFHRMTTRATRNVGNSGNTTVTVANGAGTTLATTTITSAQAVGRTTTTSFTSASQSENTLIRFAITAVGSNVEDIRTNLYFRRNI